MELNPGYLLKFLLLYQEIRFYLPHSSTIIGESRVELVVVVVPRRGLEDSVELIGSTVAQFHGVWVSIVPLEGVDVSIWQFCSSD